MPGHAQQPPSPLEHIRGHLDIPRTPSPGAHALLLDAPPPEAARPRPHYGGGGAGHGTDAPSLRTAHGTIKAGDLGYAKASFAGKDEHRKAVLDVRPPLAPLRTRLSPS